MFAASWIKETGHSDVLGSQKKSTIISSEKEKDVGTSFRLHE